MLLQAPRRPTTGLAVRWTDSLVWAAILVYLLLHLPYLTAWPTPHNDEARELNAFWVAAGVAPNAQRLDPEFGADPLYKGGLQGLTVGTAMKLGGLGLLQGRVVSLLWGGLLLGATFLLGRRLYGAAAGLLALVALAVSRPFLTSAHMVRPDAVLAAVLVAAAWLAVRAVQDDDRRAALAGGLLAGLAFDVHLNAVVFLPLLGLLFLVPLGRGVFAAPTARLFAAGLGIGLVYFLVVRILADPGQFASSSAFWIGQDHRPPILAGSLGAALAEEVGRFRDYVTEDRRVEAAWLVAALAYAGWDSVRRRRPDPLLLGVLAAFALFTLVVSSKAQFYMILYYPWLALLLGALLARVAGVLALPRPVMVAGLAVLTAFVLGLPDNYEDMATAASNEQEAGFGSLMAELRPYVPDGARVLGPPLFWLGLADHPYTDYYVWERLRAQRRERFSFFMERTDHEIVILDAKAKHQVSINSPGFLETQYRLLASVRRVGFDRVEVWKRR